MAKNECLDISYRHKIAITDLKPLLSAENTSALIILATAVGHWIINKYIFLNGCHLKYLWGEFQAKLNKINIDIHDTQGKK